VRVEKVSMNTSLPSPASQSITDLHERSPGVRRAAPSVWGAKTEPSNERRRRARIADAVLVAGFGAAGFSLGALGVHSSLLLGCPAAMLVATFALAKSTRDWRARAAAGLACAAVAGLPMFVYLTVTSMPAFTVEAIASLSSSPLMHRATAAWGLLQATGTALLGLSIAALGSAALKRGGYVAGALLWAAALTAQTFVLFGNDVLSVTSPAIRAASLVMATMHMWVAFTAYRAWKTFVR